MSNLSHPSGAREKQNDQRLDLKSTSLANSPADESELRSPSSHRGLRTFPIARRCRSLVRGKKLAAGSMKDYTLAGNRIAKCKTQRIREGSERDYYRFVESMSDRWKITVNIIRGRGGPARHKRIQFAQENKGRTITTCIQWIRIVLGRVFADEEKEGTCITRPSPSCLFLPCHFLLIHESNLDDRFSEREAISDFRCLICSTVEL